MEIITIYSVLYGKNKWDGSSNHPILEEEGGVKQIQIRLLPAGSRILTAVAHHGTHCGKSAAGVWTYLSCFYHVIDAFLIQLSLKFGYLFLQCVRLDGIRIGFGKLTSQFEFFFFLSNLQNIVFVACLIEQTVCQKKFKI